MKSKNFFLGLLCMFITFQVSSQELKVKQEGIVIPSVPDHTTISSPEDGQLVYNSTSLSFWYYQQSSMSWKEVGKDNMGEHKATQDVDMSLYKIINIATPTEEQDAANKLYVDGHEDGDADSLNELQEFCVSKHHDTLFLTQGNYLIIPGISDANAITDGDGNRYSKIRIGDQIWLKENLRSTTYNDGTAIPLVENSSTWNSTSPRYCWYNNDSLANAELYGALYNYFVISETNAKNVCPVGYRVPIRADVEELIDYIEVIEMMELDELKSDQVDSWINYAQNTDSFNFTAVGGGRRSQTGSFTELKEFGNLWTSTTALPFAGHAFTLLIRDDTSTFTSQLFSIDKNDGASVRCIKVE